MTEPVTNPGSTASVAEAKLAGLGYATPEAKWSRRWWVYAVVGVYLLLLGGLLTFPAWVSIVVNPGPSEVGAMVVCTTTVAVCGFSLVVIPIRRVRRRPVTRGSVWFPILGSGLLAGLLVLGGGMALAEYLMTDVEKNWRILAGAGGVWGTWSVAFGLIAFRGNVEGVGTWLHRTLLAGSVLELLVAVPTHVVVRRRTECCAGILTGTGICVGVVVMFVSFGPSVLFLYYRRGREITRR